MKKIAKFLLLSTLLLATLPCFTACNEYRGIDFVLQEDGTYGVRAKSVYHKSSLTIPEVYEGRAVTAILPNGFAEATSLETVILPPSLVSIGAGAFLGCESLAEITLPSSLVSIGASAFLGCPSLPLVREGNALYLASEGSLTFYLLRATDTAITDLTVPEGTVFIADAAFAFCRALTAVALPASLRAVGLDAFEGCSALSVVTAADPSAFAAVSFESPYANPASLVGGLSVNGVRLSSLTVAEGVTGIGSHALAGFTSLTSLTLPEGLLTIGDGALAGCSALTAVTIPGSVNRIGFGAFFGCAALESVTFKTTQSWHYNGMELVAEDLEDAALAAAYLTGTYHSYVWARQ